VFVLGVCVALLHQRAASVHDGPPEAAVVRRMQFRRVALVTQSLPKRPAVIKNTRKLNANLLSAPDTPVAFLGGHTFVSVVPCWLCVRMAFGFLMLVGAFVGSLCRSRCFGAGKSSHV
jgi:hypothetical protein